MSKEKQAPVEQTEEIKAEAQVEETKTEQEAEPQTEEKGPGERYEFADVWFECGHCGHKNKLAEGLRGISYTVPAMENAEVSMECTECKTKLRLYFEESSEEVKEARRVEIAEMEKQSQETDGINKEDTKEGSEPGSVEDAERAPKVDEPADGASVATDGDGSELEANS